MALIEVIDRGNEVEFTAEFLNADGAALNPSGASVTVNFLNADGERESDVVTLAHQTDGSWFGTWDSQEARPARTYWCVRSSNPDSAEDGYFELAGNLANLADDSTS
jgi:hypothetical protein